MFFSSILCKHLKSVVTDRDADLSPTAMDLGKLHGCSTSVTDRGETSDVTVQVRLILEGRRIKAIVDEIDMETGQLTWSNKPAEGADATVSADDPTRPVIPQASGQGWTIKHANKDKPRISSVGRYPQRYNIDHVNARRSDHVMRQAARENAKLTNGKRDEQAASEMENEEGSALHDKLQAALEALRVLRIGNRRLVGAVAHTEKTRHDEELT